MLVRYNDRQSLAVACAGAAVVHVLGEFLIHEVRLGARMWQNFGIKHFFGSVGIIIKH